MLGTGRVGVLNCDLSITYHFAQMVYQRRNKGFFTNGYEVGRVGVGT